MQLNESIITPSNTSSDLHSLQSQPMSQSIQKPVGRSSVSGTAQKRNSYTANQHRQTLVTINSDLLTQRTSSSFLMPLLIDTMNTFFQTVQTMEEEIMLPSRLKDMPVEGKTN